MANYIDTDFGAISADIPAGAYETIKGLLRSHIRNANDHAVLTSGVVIKESIDNARIITGKSFQGFLKANYHHGMGRRASTVRAICQYLNGEISGNSLASVINRDITQLSSNLQADSEEVLPTQRQPSLLVEAHVKLLNAVDEDDFFRFIEGIGPQMLSRFMMSFMGDLPYES